MTLTRCQSQTYSAIRSHFRETGCPPSLGDISRRIKASRQRACALVYQLERAGLITRRHGEALSIRLVGHMGNFSDDDLIHQLAIVTEELVSRGVDVMQASVSVALKKSFPLTIMELPGDDFGADILAQMEGGDGGCGEEGRTEPDAAGGDAPAGELAGTFGAQPQVGGSHARPGSPARRHDPAARSTARAA